MAIENAINEPEPESSESRTKESPRLIAGKVETVHQRMLSVMRRVQPLAKEGHNEKQNYDFVEMSLIAAHIRDLLVGEQLLLRTEFASLEIQTVERKGSSVTIVVAKFNFTIYCADNPEDKIEWKDWPGEAHDYGDKALNKAGTTAQKYFLIRQFLLSDVDPDYISPGAPEDTPAKKPKEPKVKDEIKGKAELPPGDGAARSLVGAWKNFTIKIATAPKTSPLRKGIKIGELLDSQIIELDRWLQKQPADAHRDIRANLAMTMAERNLIPKESSLDALKKLITGYKIGEPEFIAHALKGEWVHDTCESINSIQEADAEKILLGWDAFIFHLEQGRGKEDDASK